MRLSVEYKYKVGDLVTVTPQRVAAEKDVSPIMVGQILAVRVEYRSQTSISISYLIELAFSDGPFQNATFEESVLELHDEHDERDE